MKAKDETRVGALERAEEGAAGDVGTPAEAARPSPGRGNATGFEALLGVLLLIGKGALWAVALLVVLMILVPVFLPCGHHHGKSRRINCAGNLKQVGLAMRMYSGDNDEVFPPDLYTLVEGDYLTAVKVYQCPSVHYERSRREQRRRTEDITRATFKTDYVYFTGLRESADDTTVPLACDRATNHNKYGNVLFADGHVKGFAGAEWWKSAGIETRPE